MRANNPPGIELPPPRFFRASTGQPSVESASPQTVVTPGGWSAPPDVPADDMLQRPRLVHCSANNQLHYVALAEIPAGLLLGHAPALCGRLVTGPLTAATGTIGEFCVPCLAGAARS